LQGQITLGQATERFRNLNPPKALDNGKKNILLNMAEVFQDSSGLV